MEKSFVLFDCDTGTDDAIALMMLLGQSHSIETVGITCAQGNTSLDHVVMNNLRILKLYNQLDKIPVFKGCGLPLIPINNPVMAPECHGSDGLGDQPDFFPEASPKLLEYVEEEHAAQAIVRLSKKYSGKLKIVATGPLTNLALAVKLDPELPSRLMAVYIMGGTRFARGNTSPAAEFNFYYDPEAAYLTLQCYSNACPVHLINYEYTCKNRIPWKKYADWLSVCQNKKQEFAKMVLKPLEELRLNKKTAGIVICDAYAMAIAIDPTIGVDLENVRVCVELGGHHSRGHVVVDYMKKDPAFVSVVMYNDVDMEKFVNLLKEAFMEQRMITRPSDHDVQSETIAVCDAVLERHPKTRFFPVEDHNCMLENKSWTYKREYDQVAPCL